MIKKKLVLIGSNLDKAVEWEWVTTMLKNNYNISVILLNQTPSYLGGFLKSEGILTYELLFKNKRDIIPCFFKVLKLILKIKPDIIHTHLFEASLIGLTIGKILKIKKNIYTRHHSSFHHIYHKKTIKYDRYCNFMATDIIAISQTVKTILTDWENVSEKKISIIPHGLDFEIFEKIKDHDIEQMRNKYNINKSDIVIGVISRYTEWKGIQYIIPAFENLLKDFPNAKLILANAIQGEYISEIQTLLSKLPNESYLEIYFEYDFQVLYKLFNVFVHTPIDYHSEAFGQIYIESLASKIPSVFTKSGIGNEFLINNVNCIVVDYQNSEQIYLGIKKYLNNPNFTKNIIEKAFEDVKMYSMNNKIILLKKLYES